MGVITIKADYPPRSMNMLNKLYSNWETVPPKGHDNISCFRKCPKTIFVYAHVMKASGGSNNFSFPSGGKEDVV